MTDGLDELFESLTIERIVESGQSPPYGGWNGSCVWSTWRWPTNTLDIAYRNTEGKYHRIYGPAYISKHYGVEIWYKNGEFHRLDGPAITHKTSQLWYKEGKLHRIGGPAVINLGRPKEFWIEGSRLPPKEYKREMQRRARKGLL